MTRIKGYTKIFNGRPITVAEYQKNTATGEQAVTPEKTPLTLARPPIAAQKGEFPGGRSTPGIFLQHAYVAPPEPSPHLLSPPKQKPAKKVRKQKPPPSKPVKEGAITWKGGRPFIVDKNGEQVPASRDDLAAAGSKRLK